MMLRLARLCMTGLAAAALILGGQTAASARTGTVQIQLLRAGLVVGVSEGGGILNFRGRQYRLAVSGASFGATVGISRADLFGYAYNLRRPSDIEGDYSATQAGLSIVGGSNAARLTNSRGVVLELRGQQVGFMFSIDLSGMRILLRR
jgi:hypothetical protein